MTTFNELQQIKRRFFAFRNGVVSERLRKAGSPFRIIFGLNLPQIKEIATEFGRNNELADSLWDNSSTRESMLIAPMLVVPEKFDIEKARRWISQIPATEVADLFCHSLLRFLCYCGELMTELAESDNDMNRYVALRLSWQFIKTNRAWVENAARKEYARRIALTRGIARQLIDEIEFLNEEGGGEG